MPAGEVGESGVVALPHGAEPPGRAPLVELDEHEGLLRGRCVDHRGGECAVRPLHTQRDRSHVAEGALADEGGGHVDAGVLGQQPELDAHALLARPVHGQLHRAVLAERLVVEHQVAITTDLLVRPQHERHHVDLVGRGVDGAPGRADGEHGQVGRQVNHGSAGEDRHHSCFRRDNLATVRAIARRAGVDPSLVIQYYGSKADLFASAIRLNDADDRAPHLDDVLDKRLGELPPETRAPIRSMLTSPEAAASMKAYLDERVANLARAADGPDAELSAALTVSSILGLTIARHFLALDALADIPEQQVETVVRPWLTAGGGT